MKQFEKPTIDLWKMLTENITSSSQTPGGGLSGTEVEGWE